MSKTLGFFNLTGGLNTVQDYATINSNPSRTETPDMLNIEYYKLGGIQTMKGNTQVGNKVEGKVTCGYEYIVGNNVYMIITDSLDNIYEYDKLNDTFTKIGTMEYNQIEGQLHDSRHSMIGYNNGVVIVNGWSTFYYNKVTGDKKTYIPIFEVTNTTTSVETGDNTYTTTEIVKSLDYQVHPNCIASSQGRLFYGCNSVDVVMTNIDGVDTPAYKVVTTVSTTTGGTTTTADPVTTYEKVTDTTYDSGMLIYSGVGLGTQETWVQGETNDDAGAFKEFFEDTSNFTALGTWAEFIVIHKLQNTYILDCSGSLSSDWTLKHYSEYTTDSQQSYIKVNNGYYTYVKEAGGIYALLTRSIYNNTYQGGDFSAKIKDSFEYLDTERYNEIYATYNPKKKYIMFYMPMTDNVTSEGEFNGSSDCFIMDLQTKSWLHRKVPQYVTAAFKFDDNTYIGTSDGLVLQEFRGKTFNGEAIQFHYITPPFLWGGGTNKTTTKEFRVKLVSDQSNHFYVESYRDGNHTAKSKRLVKNIGDNLGGLIWDLGYNYPTPVEGSTTQFTDLGDCNPTNFTYHYDTDGNIVYILNQKDDTYYQYSYNNSSVYTQTPPCGFDGTENLVQNIPVYSDNTGSILDGYSQEEKYYTTTEGTEANHNRVTYTTATSYGWVEKTNKEICYSDGTYYAWVNSETGVCTTNLKYTAWTEWYGITLGNQLFRVKEWILNEINQNLNKKAASWIMYQHPDDMQYYYQHWSQWVSGQWTDGGFPWSQQIYTMMQYGKYADDGLNSAVLMYDNGNWSLIQRNQVNKWKNASKITTGESGNPNITGDQKKNEQPSGSNPTTITKTFTQGDEKITFSITQKGVTRSITLPRYSAGDRGQATSTTYYYTDSSSPSIGDTAYSDVSLTISYGSITAKTTDTITVNSTVYTRYTNADSTRQVPHYWIATSIFATEPTTTSGTAPVYPYSTLGEGEIPKTLTDSTWDYTQTDIVVDNEYILDRPETTEALIQGKQDGKLYEDVSLVNSSYTKYDEIDNNLRGDAWLAQGYQTKRMLLPTQYFEVIQFRFSGGYNDTNNQDGNYDDNLCITGFEVDGIQLAETPMA